MPLSTYMQLLPSPSFSFMTPSNVHIARCKRELAYINNTPHINAVFLPTAVPASLDALIRRELANVPADAVELEIESVCPRKVRRAIMAYGRKKNIPILANINSPKAAELWHAIYQQVRLYRRISGAKRVTLGLHINTHHAPVFHVDGYPHIVTRTLVGDGTLWVPNTEVDESLRQHYVYTDLAPQNPRQVPTGWIVAERGYKGGFIHSSPQSTAGTRLLVLALDRKNPTLPYLYAVEKS